MIQVGHHLLVGCPGKKWFHCLRLQVFHSMWWEKATAELYILYSHFDNWLSKEVICFNFNKMLPFSPVYSHDPLLIFTNFWDPCLCRSQLSEVNVLQVTVLFFFFFFLPYVLALGSRKTSTIFQFSLFQGWLMEDAYYTAPIHPPFFFLLYVITNRTSATKEKWILHRWIEYCGTNQKILPWVSPTCSDFLRLWLNLHPRIQTS